MLLGTAGGPLPSPSRAGISQAVVVAGRVLVVDCGSGVARQLRRARLLSRLHQVFLTHLHSDHDCDYFNLFLLGWPVLQWNPAVAIYGPGPAGGLAALPPDPPGLPPIPLMTPTDPTPGLIGLTQRQIEAHSYDLNIRMREAGRADLSALMAPHEISLPAAVGAHGPDLVAPPMDPILVTETDDVRVTAILVAHAPVFPSFAYRFDTADGSIVISGDTAPSANLAALAADADILVHEVFSDQRQASAEPDDSWEARQREHHLQTSHTPLSQVGRVAAEAGIGHLVLTHFIPGDDVLPDDHWIDGVRGDFDGPVTVGHDLLELSL
ncbi:MAG: MBL fold metallo-hydrolase [Actinomycetota bacterium]|nr:MBL fold metallo-hydrolase [Actinomycetota bacterium]